MLKFETTSQNNTLFQLHYKNQHLPDVKNITFLGIETDNFMNWKAHVKLILPRIGHACFAIRNIKCCSNIETLRMIYLAYFHSIISMGLFSGVTRQKLRKFSFYKKGL
jgi:hypothetical protein